MDAVLARIDRPDGRVAADPAVDDAHRPVLLAVSVIGPQVTSGSTREFMALHAIAVHFGRPGTPADQAWIETFFSHLKAEFPHLPNIGEPAVLRAQHDHFQVRRNTVRLHAGIGYFTPDDEHTGRGEQMRKDREAAWNEPDKPGLPTAERTGSMIASNTQKDPAMLSDTTRSCIANSEIPQPSPSMSGQSSRRLHWPIRPRRLSAPVVVGPRTSLGPDAVVGKGDGRVDVPVTRSAPSTSAVSVIYNFADVTAGTNPDYTCPPAASTAP